MKLEELKASYRLIDLFVELAEVPSPSFKEEKVTRKILELLNIYCINAQKDAYGNIIAKIPAHPNCKNVPPLLLSAHMDVVGGTDPVNVRLSGDGKYIETDKTRTLGGDDKAGLAAILDLAIELNGINANIEHGPIEISFTRDEETCMTGITNLDTSKIQSKYALILDGEYLGELDVEGAGFTNIYIKVSGGKGGHSGTNIGEKDRVSAIKVLSELDAMIYQGAYKEDERGVITSINAGVSVGGTANVYIAEILKDVYELAREKKPIPEKYNSKNILNTINHEAALNVISNEAYQAYSLRSSNKEYERELIASIKDQVSLLNKKYSGLIKIDVEVKSHLMPFEKSPDEFLPNVVIEAGKNIGLEIKPVNFHAGAESHVLANDKKNAKGESFVPVIVGVANMANIHSADEKIEWKSFLEGRKLLEQIVVTFAGNFNLFG